MKLLKNSIITPLVGTMDSFTGGIYTSDGQFIEDSILYRGHQSKLQQAIEHLDGTYIYGGCLFAHFGHFIWESLSRLYAIRQCKRYPILFITPNSDKILKQMTIFFKSIGVTNEIHLVKVQTSVENLIYSSPGSSIKPLFISDEQFNSFKYINSVDKWGETAHCSKEKVWLSRSKWTTGLVTNEQIIEEDLKKIGYRIVHPENMSLREQVKIISTSKIVSGFDGSQFFTLLFAKNISGKFIVFNRRKYIPATLSYVFQRLNLEYKEYVFDLETNDCNMKIHYPYHNNIIENLNKYA